MGNDSELRALLDEAITYKCPKDREGKSHLFKELLQEAEADETEEGHRVICNSRCLPGSNRRRHKRDSVSERLTHGGSLQNLALPLLRNSIVVLLIQHPVRVILMEAVEKRTRNI